MKKTTIFLLRDNLATYLADVEKTNTPLVIYKYKKPIAVINPIGKDYVEEDPNKYYGFLASDDKETGVEFENRVRRNKIEKERVKKFRNRK